MRSRFLISQGLLKCFCAHGCLQGVRENYSEFRKSGADLANRLGGIVVQKISVRKGKYKLEFSRQGQPPAAEKGVAVTSEAPQVWFVMLQDEAAAGRVLVPLRPFLKFSRRMDKQLVRLEKQVRKAIPQLARRGSSSRCSKSNGV